MLSMSILTVVWSLQGDITRYGERKISGLMKDGYNSAHRYYLNVFRDTYRQVLIGESIHQMHALIPCMYMTMSRLVIFGHALCTRYMYIMYMTLCT